METSPGAYGADDEGLPHIPSSPVTELFRQVFGTLCAKDERMAVCHLIRLSLMASMLEGLTQNQLTIYVGKLQNL
jgi:hypothetical protein